MKKTALLLFSLISLTNAFGQYEGKIDPKVKFPLDVLIPETSIRTPRISPDGTHVLFVQESGSNSYITLADNASIKSQKQLLSFPNESVDQLEWLDNTYFVYSVDENHDGVFDIYKTNVENIEKTTKISSGSDARITNIYNGENAGLSFVQYNAGTKSFDLLFYTSSSENSKTIIKNLPSEATHLTCDWQSSAALFSIENKSGQELYLRSAKDDSFNVFITCTENDRVFPLRFSPSSSTIYALSNVMREYFALVEIDLASGKEVNVLSSNSLSDIQSVGFSVGNNMPLYSTTVVDGQLLGEGHTPAADNVFNTAGPIIGGTFEIVSQDEKERLFVLRKINFNAPTSYVVYNSQNKSFTNPFAPETFSLPKELIAKTIALHFTLSDGSPVKAVFNMPRGSNSSAMVIMLNEYNSDFSNIQMTPEVQNLCNQNRAVLRVMLPGTYGYGKKYLNIDALSNTEWFAEMVDAVGARLKQEFNFSPQSLSLFSGTASTPFIFDAFSNKIKLFRTFAIQNAPLWADQNGICYREHQWSVYGQSKIHAYAAALRTSSPSESASQANPYVVVSSKDQQTKNILPGVSSFTQLKEPALRRTLWISNEQKKINHIMK